MDSITQSLDALVSGFGYFLYAAYHSFFFAVVKFIIGIYVIVLIVDIILLLYQRGLSGDFRETSLGMNMPPELITNKGKSDIRKKWDKVRQRLESGAAKEYKLAIIEADEIIGDLIRRMNYPGENFGERLSNIPSGQVETISELQAAHEIRNKIIMDESFALSKEEAENTIKLYEEFLKYHLVL